MKWLKKITGVQGGEHKESPTTAQPVEVPETERPRNQLEQAVHDAPPVVSTLNQTEARLRADALHTMEIMEAARADKGNFCLTIGSGDMRAVLLVSPIEGRVLTAITPADKYRPEETHSFTYTDFVLLTPQGPRRVGFKTNINSSLYPHNSSTTSILSDEKTALVQFQAIVSQCTRDNTVSLPESRYSEYIQPDGSKDFTLLLRQPVAEIPHEVIRKGSISVRSPEWNNAYPIGIVEDQDLPLQALQKSLQKVQAPVNTQIASARKQISVVSDLRSSLK